MALLHAAGGLRPRLEASLRAIHVHHGLHPQADHWARFCEEACGRLAVPCNVIRVDARPPQGQSPEAWARRRRYEVFERALGAEQMLLTAHHQDDQAETLLLQLFRGAGPRGLASMPACVEFGPGWLARPLLDFSRGDLQAYADEQGLQWIEDPSNRELRFDRNFLRHEVIPKLKEHWPQLGRTLSRAAVWQAEAVLLLDILARQDLASCAGRREGTLSVTALKALDGPRRRQVIRRWLRDARLPAPAASHLERITEDLFNAHWDATPCVAWPGAEVRRYRDVIYAMAPLPVHDPRAVYPWNLSEGQPAPLPPSLGRLRVERTEGRGVKVALCENRRVTVRFRQGGERCRPPGRQTHSLKHLFQEVGVPPWLRDRTPLIYLDDKLAAVPGLCECQPFAAEPGEAGWDFRWSQHLSL